MTWTLLASAALLAAWGSSAGAATHGRPERRAEVIVLVERTSSVSPGGRVPDDKTIREPTPEHSEANPADAAFRTHDLSRHWVAFEMAGSFRSNSDDAAKDGKSGPATLPRSDTSLPAPMIAIPLWMTNGSSFATAPTSFSNSCADAAYRPSGFLDTQTENRRLGFYGMMSSIACAHGIPVGLFDAMIIRESGYRSDVYSARNAYGLTQLMPGTAAGLGVNRYDVEQNLHGGARYLREQLDRFGAVHLALAAYNAGPGRVKNGFVPRIAQTQAYVENVLTNWQRLASSTNQKIAPMGGAPVTPQAPAPGRIAVVSSY